MKFRDFTKNHSIYFYSKHPFYSNTIISVFAGWPHWPHNLSTERLSKGSHHAKYRENAGGSFERYGRSWATFTSYRSRKIYRG